jgi:hypothetical protein
MFCREKICNFATANDPVEVFAYHCGDRQRDYDGGYTFISVNLHWHQIFVLDGFNLRKILILS